jgi:hypothetical protein
MPYYERALALWEQLKVRSGIEWIPRAFNGACDGLSKQVLRDRGVQFRIQPEGGGR